MVALISPIIQKPISVDHAKLTRYYMHVIRSYIKYSTSSALRSPIFTHTTLLKDVIYINQILTSGIKKHEKPNNVTHAHILLGTFCLATRINYNYSNLIVAIVIPI